MILDVKKGFLFCNGDALLSVALVHCVPSWSGEAKPGGWAAGRPERCLCPWSAGGRREVPRCGRGGALQARQCPSRRVVPAPALPALRRQERGSNTACAHPGQPEKVFKPINSLPVSYFVTLPGKLSTLPAAGRLFIPKWYFISQLHDSSAQATLLYFTLPSSVLSFWSC